MTPEKIARGILTRTPMTERLLIFVFLILAPLKLVVTGVELLVRRCRRACE